MSMTYLNSNESYKFKRIKMKWLNGSLNLILILFIGINTAFGVGWQREDEAVILPDPNLEAAIRETLGKPEAH